MTQKTRVAINGFGRIGKIAARIILDDPSLELVAINGKGVAEVAQYLKYDSVHGKLSFELEIQDDFIHVKNLYNPQKIKVISERDPEKLPWKDLMVEVVLECTGVFRDSIGAGKHIIAGASKVIISAPPKSPEIPTFVLGVNSDILDNLDDSINIISNASCTTNCISPALKVLVDNFNIENLAGLTVHAYTASQQLVDGYDPDSPRGGRAGALNTIPDSTGAAKAVELVIPDVKGKLSLSSVRIPVPTGSMMYMVVNLDRESTVEEVNSLLKNASETYLKGILEYSTEDLVSSDIIGNLFSSVVDSKLTKVKGKTVELTLWYDNEMGYSARLVEMINKIIKK